MIVFFTISKGQGIGSNGAMNAKNLAMAATNAVSARGVFAIGVNPANLVIKQNHKWEFSTLLPLPTLTATIGNDFFSLNDYKYFFTGVTNDNGQKEGRHLTVNDKERLLKLFDQGTLVNTSVGTTILAFSMYPNKKIGALGFSVNDWTSVNLNFPKEILELLLYGNQKGKTFSLNDLDFKGWYLRNYSLSYSRDLSELFPDAFKFFAVGITLKMVHGLFYSGVDYINTSIETKDNYDISIQGNSRILTAASPSFGIKYDFEDENIEKQQNIGFFNKPAGTGYGVDLGIYAGINKAWSFAIALTDLGTIKWNNGVVAYSSNGSYTIKNVTDKGLLDSLKNSLKGKGSYAEPFSTSLATAMKLGVGLQIDKLLKRKFPGKMLLEFNYHQGFNTMPGNTKKERFSFGMQWTPFKWFNFRSGLSLGGYDKFNWAIGFGFDTGILDLDFAASYFQSFLDGNNAKRLGVAMSSRWKF